MDYIKLLFWYRLSRVAEMLKLGTLKLYLLDKWFYYWMKRRGYPTPRIRTWHEARREVSEK